MRLNRADGAKTPRARARWAQIAPTDRNCPPNAGIRSSGRGNFIRADRAEWHRADKLQIIGGHETAFFCRRPCRAGVLRQNTILVHGHIFTGNPAQKWSEAIAISGNRIGMVGSDVDVLKLRGGKTKVIDLQGRTVIPGIVDSHTHLWFGALALHGFNLATPELWIDPETEARAFAVKVKEYASSHPKDRVLFGRAVFPNDVTHELLDQAVSDRPVVIHAATEHMYWVNQKAIEMARIGTEPVGDPGVEKFIVRDANRKPTGVFRESSMQLIERALPPQPIAEKMQWMREAALYLNRYGITSVTNATGSLAEIQVYGALRDKHQLTVRTKTAFGSVAVKHKLTPEFLAQLDQARTTYHDDWVSANLVKFFSDGAGGPPLYETGRIAVALIWIWTSAGIRS